MAEERNVSVRIEGLADLRRRLKTVKGGLDDLKAVNRRAAETAFIASRGLVPIGATAKLFASGRFSGTRTAGFIRYGNAAVPYALPIHWGWPTRPDHLRGWYGGPIIATPFASLGAQISEPLWYEQYVKEIERLWNL